ncbi:hypothetical protein B7P43_G07407 [Cryptotermes secundus]|uniref:SKICH domain-containing protein n=1 Tax=Cryptotermes secundus TaxID=105785 RepID=A0A2J7RAM2_9NEOP|nr:calcium-binding and coiled-coil domain-containing protein 2 isoform X2 [Cryptotermes secundus]PNF37875.1 hypothetical protein B7P43_G07407 [Cryptotermes secundus]
MPVELIKFHNVKAKYYLNEDILLEYVLHDEIQPSSYDWIGLYPHGWKNLHQYITFEWVITRPCEVALQRNVLFQCKYHSEDVWTDKKYQFIYVNKQLEVLGCSQYFRFLGAGLFTDTRNNVHSVSSEKVGSSEEQISKMKDHIQDLENDLQMSQLVQKQLELTVHHLKREKLSYKKFVKELICALSQKGNARIIDGQGSEMLVKKVSSNDKHHPQDAVRTSRKEGLLKTVDSSQDQTIQELLMQLDTVLAMKMELPTTYQNNIEEEPPNPVEPMKQVARSLFAVTPCEQVGTIVEVPEPERGLNDQQNNMEGASVSDPCETGSHSQKF